ncbi:hypothetical protein F5887DRAFT_271985 [Amanita rubescens]|nr:hypothetical protein F5887DRAFT_271985 [Amanita rubescens]
MRLLPIYEHHTLGKDDLWTTIRSKIVELLDQRDIQHPSFVSAGLKRTRRARTTRTMMRMTRMTRMTRTTRISISRSPRAGQSLPLPSQSGWESFPILLLARSHSTLQMTSSRRAPSEPGPPQSHTRDRGQKSTNCWEVALQLAQQCRDKFKEPVETVDDIERNSTAALELLARSVRSIPRASRFTGAADPSSIKDLACRMVHTKYLDMIHNKLI